MSWSEASGGTAWSEARPWSEAKAKDIDEVDEASGGTAWSEAKARESNSSLWTLSAYPWQLSVGLESGIR